MSPRRFDGWEPQEVHQHFAADGETPCRAADAFITVVTREAEWDEESRGRALRLAEYRRTLCPCGCGFPVSVAHDPKAVIGVGSYTCMAQRAIEVKKRRDEEDHKKDQPNRDGSNWNDGKHYYAVPQD